jgi:mono/diheme cytochrome c family protein
MILRKRRTMNRPLRSLTLVLPAVALLISGNLRAAEPVDYLRDVRPILATHCSPCHGPQKQQAGLRLDTARDVLKGSNSGPVVQPGKSQDSLLFKAISGSNDVRIMPPKEPRLTREQVAVAQQWIDQGPRCRPPRRRRTRVGRATGPSGRGSSKRNTVELSKWQSGAPMAWPV